MSNSILLFDETAHHEPFHRDLGCLQKPVIIAYDSERVKVVLDDTKENTKQRQEGVI